MELKQIKLADIRPYWRNPRNNDAAVAAVRQSIKDYGFQQPLVVDLQNVIIAGHTRYRALIELGADAVPCVVADLPAEKAKAYRIADNKTAEMADWDMPALIQELRELDASADSDLQAYFPDANLDDLLSVGDGHEAVTSDAIQQADLELSTRFDGADQRAAQRQIEIACPSCGEKCFVGADDVLRRLGEKG